jgi:hypothetical protein
VIAAEEIAAGIANDGVLLFAQRGQHVGAQAARVGMGRRRIIDAA